MRSRARSATLLVVVAACLRLSAATVPSGFSDTPSWVSGLSNPTAFTFAPDGRLFVCQQGGQLRVIKNGALLATPFLTVTVSSSGERGLLGVAFDPDFASNRWVYVYYTATTPAIHNRISRFTADAGNPDVAQAGSEVVIRDLQNLSSATNHNGGAIHFGPDGKLYAAVGDNANGANAQSLSTELGKMLRMNKDGSIPASPDDNVLGGRIWAMGLRNPFTFSFQHGSSRMFINDVGQNTYEEVNDGIEGANYGWPSSEGPTGCPGTAGYTCSIYYYSHASGGCAITGGAFYNGPTQTFPSSYAGDYFFADYCGGWIRSLDYGTVPAVVTDFASGINAPVDLTIGPDGALYYLARGNGAVGRVQYTANQAPGITQQPQSQTVAQGGTATFTVVASGSQPLSYQWRRNGGDIGGATSSSYSLPNVQPSDSGALFSCRVSNDFGNLISDDAQLTVTANQPPTGVIVNPPAGTTYFAGQTISYSGTGSDPQDGTLGGSAFTWQVDFGHDAHFHPFVPATTGSTSGSFTIPTTGETATNVFYRILLTVRDSGGLTHTTFRDITPQTVTLTLASNPPGLSLTLDSIPVATPHSTGSVRGMQRTLGAPSPQSLGGTTYTFVSWSDGGAQTHTIATPSASTTYTATFTSQAPNGTGLSATYFNNKDLTGTTVTRVDPTVNFDWGKGSPAAGIDGDTFSARWTGQVQPQFSETYTFYSAADDGSRLWVNGQLVVDRWTNNSGEGSGTIALTGGQKYTITLEHFENKARASERLSWSSPSQPKQIIPQVRLYTP